jgi:hypothetical protein
VVVTAVEPTNPDVATPSDSRGTALRPLAGPAWGAVAAAGVLTIVLLGRLPAHWAAYQALAAHAGGAQDTDFPGALYDARPGLASLLGEPMLFGAFLACLATWVLRARRNAGALRPDHPFRFSPTGAMAGVLVPLGNLWFTGPVVTEIADAGRPAELRDRRLPERVWWSCGQVAAGALVAAAVAVAVAWTPLGRQGPMTDPLPTSREVTAQLAVAVLNGVAVATLAAMTALLAVTLTRIGRDQRRVPAASAPQAGGPPVAPRRGLAAGALAEPVGC